MGFERVDLILEATELRLGLPGTTEARKQKSPSLIVGNKRALFDVNEDSQSKESPNGSSDANHEANLPRTAQIVGWPPVRSSRKICLQQKKSEAEGLYVKVSVDGAPYLRKIDLKVYKCYPELLKALEDMFKFKVGVYSESGGYNGSEYVPTYEDKDGDWMLVGDVPWDMFISSCKRLRIMRGSEAKGLGCSA